LLILALEPRSRTIIECRNGGRILVIEGFESARGGIFGEKQGGADIGKAASRTLWNARDFARRPEIYGFLPLL
jgi:hypothetical protein